MTVPAPHEVAERIAAAIEPSPGTGTKERREALEWAAQVARTLFPPPKVAEPTPVVLVKIDRDSRISILQSDDVLVAYLDCREAHDGVVVLPRTDKTPLILEELRGRHLVSLDEDFKGIARNTVGQIARRAVVVASMKEAAE